jgi:TonB family protein
MTDRFALGGRALVACAAGLLLGATLARGDSTIARIQEIAASRDLARNRELCREILADDPKSWAAQFCEGYEAIFLGMPEDARYLLETALTRRSDFALGALLYGRAYEALGEPRRAEDYYRWAIDLQPRRTDTRNALGRLYLAEARKGDSKAYADALEAFRQMAEADPDSPDGFTNMGIVLTEMDRLDDAQSLMERALSKNPDDPALYANLAALHFRRNEPETAERYWRQALALHPGFGPAVVELANFYGRSGRFAEAINTLRAGAQQAREAPWNAEIRRNLGFALLGADAVGPARDAFIAATTSGTEDALSFLGMGHVRMMEGLTSEAANQFRRGTALDSTRAEPFLRAWGSTLRLALPEETGPMARALARVSAEPAGGPGGPEATPALVRSVLGEWDYATAAQAIEEVGTQPAPPGMSDYDVPPTPLDGATAPYPKWARDRGLEGDVKIRATVDVDGRVVEAAVESSTADPALADAALEAVFKWRFEPAKKMGQPVEASFVIPLRFRKE